MNITGKTVQMGVIGNPIAHSISPQLHNTMIERMGIDYVYSAFRVEQGNVKKAIDGMRALNIRGFNVTIPHKTKAFELCDEVDPFAEKMGACNTLVNTNGVIRGYNTDGPGFIRALSHKGVDVRGKNIMVLGAGGAAQGVCIALADAGAKNILITNRTQSKAKDLAEKINSYYPGVTSAGDGWIGVKADILVNTTSVGMNSEESPIDELTGLSLDAVVCDIVYCPRETAFLKMAREKGYKTVGGIGMLINQAVIAFELFTGKEVSEETISYLYRMTELEKSIVLTGFMGTGKTTVAKRLCALTGAEFIDTDKLIEKREGMEISEIFAKYGEKYFRDAESEVIESLRGKKGAVISTGGGAVIKRKNIDNLRENGVIFCLNTDIERVYKNIGGKTDSRPLLSGKTMEEAKALLESRREYYANCDFALDVTEMEKEAVADKMLEIYMNEI